MKKKITMALFFSIVLSSLISAYVYTSLNAKYKASFYVFEPMLNDKSMFSSKQFYQLLLSPMIKDEMKLFLGSTDLVEYDVAENSISDIPILEVTLNTDFDAQSFSDKLSQVIDTVVHSVQSSIIKEAGYDKDAAAQQLSELLAIRDRLKIVDADNLIPKDKIYLEEVNVREFLARIDAAKKKASKNPYSPAQVHASDKLFMNSQIHFFKLAMIFLFSSAFIFMLIYGFILIIQEKKLR